MGPLGKKGKMVSASIHETEKWAKDTFSGKPLLKKKEKRGKGFVQGISANT